jgi:hypothetical protein
VNLRSEEGNCLKRAPHSPEIPDIPGRWPGFSSGNGSRSMPALSRGLAALLLLVAGLVGPAGALAENDVPADAPATAQADSTSQDPEQPASLLSAAATAADSTAASTQPELHEGMTAAEMAAQFAASRQTVSLADTTVADPWFKKFELKTRVGTKADVRSNNLNGKLEKTFTMRGNSSLKNTFEIGRSDFRQQDKAVDTRTNRVIYNAGNMLPFQLTANGNYDWSKDQTVNNAGFANLNRRTFKSASLVANKKDIQLGFIDSQLKAAAGMSDQHLVNRDIINDVSEEYLDGNFQARTEFAEDVLFTTRVYGRTASGERTLGDDVAPASAGSDSLTAAVKYDRGFGRGRMSVTRGNFENRFLDYRRDSNGSIDTLNDAFSKVVDEVETKDIFTLEWDHEVQIGRLGLKTKLSRDTDDLDFAASAVGRKERLKDTADLTLTLGLSRRDSVALKYGYMYKWDDQRYKGATANRGKQFNKMRQLSLFYGRRLFEDTRFRADWLQELNQDTAENGWNSNDKDRLRTNLALTLEREWSNGFETDMLFSFKRGEEVALHETRSSNNNIKDSYEISPGFNWTINEWLSINQKYRIYIQYVNYDYAGLESINKEDSYNKRGNLSTIVVIRPSDRLELAVRHDFNKRNNATKTETDGSGNSYYSTDSRQSISKIDLGVDFKVMDGVKLEAATYRTRDFKERIGSSITETEVFKGEIWVGAKVDRKWNDWQLSATVKRYNAYGPSVTPASRDFWEADAWLEWGF